MTIPTLIDKQDNSEIVRDQIAAILVAESTSQQTLATTALLNPNDWKLRVFTERSNPWEQWLNDQSNTSPIVNVWYDNSNFDKSASNVMERQKSESVFNIDCYGYGVSSDEPLSGHTPGDKEAAFEVHRAIRLVRNIIMAAEYTYLQLGTPPNRLVWLRWVQSITAFQPQIDDRAVQRVAGARIALQVDFNEFAPQVDETNLLEYLAVDLKRTETGEVYFEQDYDYTI